MRLALCIVEMRNGKRSADRSAKVIASIQRRAIRYVEVALRVEVFVAHKFIHTSVIFIAAGLGGDQRYAIARAGILRAIVRGEHLHFLNRVDARRDDEGCVVFIDADVQCLRTIYNEAVVFCAPTVDAVRDAASQTHSGLILLRLVAHTWSQGDQLRVVAAIQLKTSYFFRGDRSTDLSILRMNLSQFAPCIHLHTCLL